MFQDFLTPSLPMRVDKSLSRMWIIQSDAVIQFYISMEFCTGWKVKPSWRYPGSWCGFANYNYAQWCGRCRNSNPYYRRTEFCTQPKKLLRNWRTDNPIHFKILLVSINSAKVENPKTDCQFSDPNRAEWHPMASELFQDNHALTPQLDQDSLGKGLSINIVSLISAISDPPPLLQC